MEDIIHECINTFSDTKDDKLYDDKMNVIYLQKTHVDKRNNRNKINTNLMLKTWLKILMDQGMFLEIWDKLTSHNTPNKQKQKYNKQQHSIYNGIKKTESLFFLISTKELAMGETRLKEGFK